MPEMNKVRGYRNMIGFSQKQMAEVLNISETSYRLKENGERPFTQNEMIAFLNAVQRVDKKITLDNIFLN